MNVPNKHGLLSSLPDDRFRGLCFPWPLSCQHFVPDGAEGVDVGGLGEGKVVAVVVVDSKAAHDFRTQVAQPAFGDAHAVPKKMCGYVERMV